MLASGLAVTVIAHDGGDGARFDERSVGLDHLALHVGDLMALEAWECWPSAHDVVHSGIQDIEGGRGGSLIVLRDPDNIQIELTAGWRPST